MTPNNEIYWETVNNLERLIELKVEWDDFYLKNSTHMPFNTHTWLITWINTYWQKNWQLKLLIGRCNSSIFTIAPVYIQNTQTIFNKKTLYQIGIGEPELKEVSTEYLGIQILQGFEEVTLQKMRLWVLDLKIDEIIWRASLHSNIELTIFQSFNQALKVTEAVRYIVDCQSWTLESLSKNMRSRYRRGLNQLTKLDAKIDWVKKEDFEQYWQTMKNFHQQRWLGKNKPGAFCSDEFNLFHQEFRKQAPDNVVMSAIWINDIPIAIHYYLLDSSTLYFYQSGWNEQDYSQLSPGLILHLWGIEHNNKQFYDFMMGKKQDSYKAKFSPMQQPMYNISISFSPIKIIANRILKKIKLIKH